MRWTRRYRQASDKGADGEIAWSWRPDAGVKSWRAILSKATGAIKPGTPGRARISRNTIAQGMPECSAYLSRLACVLSSLLHARLAGAFRHPAFPVPSWFRGTRRCITRAFRAAGM